MKALFDSVSMKCSVLTTKSYSTSFSSGIKFLHSSIGEPIFAIYGFVRFADEIVDSFEGYNKEVLLNDFEKSTFEAIENGISLNPILNSFQYVVNKYNIDKELIDSFLYSMKMDLEQQYYTADKYNKYIYGSAEVVGLMCLHVFTNGDKNLFDQLAPSARKLGAAFQKVNFLRDMKADYKQLGRTYFPNVNFDNFSKEEKYLIEKEIEHDFKEALVGIKKLPIKCRAGVYLAYRYYLSLFFKIKKTCCKTIMNRRIRVTNGQKFIVMLESVIHSKLNLI